MSVQKVESLPQLTASDVKRTLSPSDRAGTIVVKNPDLIQSLADEGANINGDAPVTNGTQPLLENGSEVAENGSEAVAVASWGKLLAWNPGYPTIDLVDDTVSVGRNESCTVVLPKSVNFHSKLSGTQFTITKTLQTSRSRSRPRSRKSRSEASSAESEFIGVLEDFSSNGTFVNGRKVCKGQKQALKATDTISLVTAKNQAWIYLPSKDLSARTYPSEVTQHYVMCKTLGEGGFGQVLQAYKLDTGMWCAVKVMSKKVLRVSVEDTDLKLLKAEVDNLISLSHPNIISVIDFIDTAEDAFLFLELVTGGDLYDHIEDKSPCSESWTKIIGFQLALAVEFLHRNNITHRDIKLENVLCCTETDPPLVKLTDFGLSKIVNTQTFMHTVCGTPSYCAPEVIPDEDSDEIPKYSAKVDVYSLGVLLYACLFADTDYEGSIPEPKEDKDVDEDAERPPVISSDCRKLLMGMLAVNPDERLSSADVLAHPWFDDEDMLEAVRNIFASHDAEDLDEVLPRRRGVKRRAESPPPEATAAKTRRFCAVL